MLPVEKKTISYLTAQFAQKGSVEGICVRTEKRELPSLVTEVEALEGIGLGGDHYKSKGGKRQVTLILAEHIQTVASLTGKEDISPLLLRRNIVVSGINLLALKDKKFLLGDALLEYTGECHPCSRMEENLGAGGYNAMRGHGGITARILKSGSIKLGDNLIPVED